MKKREQTFDKALEAIHAFQEALQGTLFPCIEAEIGNLDGKHREFVEICAAVHGDFPAEKFAWCGNGKPPVSRWSYFKALLAKAFWNFPSTAALIGELAARPVLRRLCGFEDPGDVPSEGNFSKVFGAPASTSASFPASPGPKARATTSGTPFRSSRSPDGTGHTTRSTNGKAGASSTKAPTAAT